MTKTLPIRRRDMGYMESEPLAPPVIMCTLTQYATTPLSPPAYCIGDIMRLYCEPVEGATSYFWQGPHATNGNPIGWTASGNRVARGNCTMAMAGTYYCTITANGQSAISQMQVELQPFLYEQNGREVTFTSYVNASGSTNTYKWDFGDGTTSTEKNPTHEYSESGQYIVTLTVESSGTVKKTGSRTVEVG